MPDELEIVLIEAQPRSRARKAGTEPRSSTDPSPTQHSGLVLQTARDAWIYCKASKKMAAGNQMLPRLSASAAVVSGVTGVSVFVTIQEDPAVWAKIVVGAVAVVTAVITALQTWVASRIKTLNDQAHKFHQFHRDVIADIEANRDLADPDYANRREAQLQGLVVGISEPSPRAWAAAEKSVDRDAKRLFPLLWGRHNETGAR